MRALHWPWGAPCPAYKTHTNVPLNQKPFPLGRVLALGNIIIGCTIAGIAAYGLVLNRDAHLRQARHATENLAATLSLRLASELQQIDHALADAHLQLDRLSGRSTPAQAAFLAAHHREFMPQVDALNVTDERGNVLGLATSSMTSGSVAAAPYFRAAASAPDRLVVTPLLKDARTGRWSTVLARARTGDDGRFLGVVYAVIPSDHYLNAFRAVQLGRDGAVALRTDAHALVARHAPGQPAQSALIGSDHVSAELRAATAAQPAQGHFISRTALDDIERSHAYRQVDGYPLRVIVGLSTEDFLEPWKREAATTVGLAVLVVAMVAGLSLFVVRAQARLVGMHAAVHRIASEQQAVLDNDLVGMARLRDRTVVWHNRAHARLFGYAPGELMGTPARLLYPDEASFERVGQAYAVLSRGGEFRTQLQMCRKDGTLIWVDLSGVHLPSGDALWMMVDITALKENELKARQMALQDPLTGLPNRAGLDARLEGVLDRARRDGTQVAVCFLDLDGFKGVNDAHGHDAGDTLLRIAAGRIASCTRAHDLVARLGGDEFVVVLGGLRDRDEALPALDRILEALDTPFVLRRGVEVQLAASLGVAMFPQDGLEAAELRERADEAMYAVKRSGKGRYHFWGEPQALPRLARDAA